jgi:hypothetical protein
MIKDVLDGIKEVLVEVSTGMIESYKEVSTEATKVFGELEVKLMGSYEDLEALSKVKETVK